MAGALESSIFSCPSWAQLQFLHFNGEIILTVRQAVACRCHIHIKERTEQGFACLAGGVTGIRPSHHL